MACLGSNMVWCCADLGSEGQALSGDAPTAVALKVHQGLNSIGRTSVQLGPLSSALNTLGSKNGLASVQDLEIMFPEAMEDLDYCQWDGDGHFNMSRIKHLQPPSLGQVVCYTRKMIDAASKVKMVLHISSTGHQAVGAVLAGALLILERDFSAAAAWKVVLQACPPPDSNPSKAWDRFPAPFCRKGERTSSSVTVLDCLKGLESAKDLGWLSDYRKFDVAAWRLLRRKFDATWIIPGEILAMGEPSETAKNPNYPGLLPPSGGSSMERTPNSCHKPSVSVQIPSDPPLQEDLEEEASTCTNAASCRFSFSDGGDSELSDFDLTEEFNHVPREPESIPSSPSSFLDTRPRFNTMLDHGLCSHSHPCQHTMQVQGSSPICRSSKAKGNQQNIKISQIIPQVGSLSPSLKARDLTESTIMRCRDFIELMRLLGIELVLKLNYGFECPHEDKYLRAFEQANVEVRSLAFGDGSVPSKALTKDFLKQCRAHSLPGSEARQLNPIALHCKAGLGRTGVMLGCYASDHYEVDGRSFHGWVRMCRPGTVQTTEQERYLRKMVPRGKKNRSLSETLSSMLPVTMPRLSNTPSVFRRRTTEN